MVQKKIVYLSVAVVIVAIVVGVIAYWFASQPKIKTYEIGALLPLSGPLASFGAELKTIILYAEGEINRYLEERGRDWKIKVIVEDTAVDPTTHLNKLMALHGKGVKIFIGGISSRELGAALDYCNANNILIISPSSTSPALSIPDMALRYVPPDNYQGKAIAKIMWERGIRWVIPVWRGDTWGDGLANATAREFERICRDSGELCGVVEGIRYNPEAAEFTAEVSQLASKVSSLATEYGKDKVGVLLISFEEGASIISAALSYPILSEVKWQGSDGTANADPFVKYRDVAEFAIKVGLYNTMASPGESDKAEVIRKVIREELGRDPMGYTYFAYDIIWSIALAIDRVGYDPVAIKNVLPDVLRDYVGASGRIVLDQNGDRALGDYDIWAVAKEDDRYVWKVVGIYIGETDSVRWYQ